MTGDPDRRGDPRALAASVGERLARRHQDVAVAESLTSGRLASYLGAATGSGEWFAGGVIAYMPRVKFDVLGVAPGPVVCASCARQMAVGVRRLTGSAVGVALTGVGGPGPDEGQPAGTTFIAVSNERADHVTRRRFAGEPPAVVELSAQAALEILLGFLTDGPPPTPR